MQDEYKLVDLTVFLTISTNQIDALYCDEPVKPESGQYPTSQTKVNFDCLELSIKDYKNLANIKLMDQ